MNTEDKAKELYNKYAIKWHASTKDVKYYCTVCCDEILNEFPQWYSGNFEEKRKKYWEQVKEKIQSL